MNIEENVPLAPYTTFKLGGTARYFVSVETPEALSVALDYAQTRNLDFFILSGGSNILVADSGFDGLVIKMDLTKREISTRTHEVYAQAGCSLMETIFAASEQGLTGMEGMYGIPGSVGGAVRGNAGAFGVEIVDVLTSATALNSETREVRTFTKAECLFSYRDSFFKKNPEWIVLYAVFTLTLGDASASVASANETLTLRTQRQIQDIRSAGSFFMNPRVHTDIQKLFEEEKGAAARDGRVPAGWLIDKSGFKGHCEANVCTGERSANYIIAQDEASAAAVRALASTIAMKVEQDFAVRLEEEVTQLGFK